MMMFQDSNNNPKEQEKKQPEEAKIKAQEESETLKNEIPAYKVPDQEHLLLEPDSSVQQAASQTQSQLEMPSDDRMRHSIADSLMEILVNMTQSQCLHECLELLEASDPLQARSRILEILQRIDEERQS